MNTASAPHRGEGYYADGGGARNGIGTLTFGIEGIGGNATLGTVGTAGIGGSVT